MKRAAFTLMELLLVLAALSAIAGIGISGYQRQYAKSQFKSGVVGIQIDLNRVRLLAMRSGQTYLFRFIPGTGVYEIAPLKTLQEAIYRMNDELTDGYADSLGGSLFSDDVQEDFSFESTDRATAYSGAGTAPSDDLFSVANIDADFERAARARPDRSTSSSSNGLGGTLAVTDAFSQTDSDPLGLGGGVAFDASALANGSARTMTLREMNSEERAIGKTENTIAQRVNLDGLVVRKEATGNVIFTFSRLSDSTPANLKRARPRGAVDSGAGRSSLEEETGIDVGSRLGGSLTSIPTGGESEGLGGGLGAATTDRATFGVLEDQEERPAVKSLWSEPILFFPNGRTSTAVLALANVGKYSYYSEIGLRGMTGYARISSITTAPADPESGSSALTREQLMRVRNPFQNGVNAKENVRGVETGLQGGALTSEVGDEEAFGVSEETTGSEKRVSGYVSGDASETGDEAR